MLSSAAVHVVRARSRGRRARTSLVVATVCALAGTLLPGVALAAQDDGAAATTAGAAAPARYTAVPPVRLLDTRSTQPLRDGQPRTLTISGVPAEGVTAVALNLTGVIATGPGHVTAWAGGQPQPGTSNLNLTRGQTTANLSVVPVGPAGTVQLALTGSATHVIADLQGYYSTQTGARFTSAASRVLDTRASLALRDGQPRTLTIPGLPADGVTAVALNLTGVGASGPGHVTAWAGGQSQPGTSNLNLTRGVIRANLSIVPIGPGGTVDLALTGSASHLVVDLQGWYSTDTGAAFIATGRRLLDTRSSHPLRDGRPHTLAIPGLPADGVTAVAINLTGVGVTGPGHVTGWASGQLRPETSNLNLTRGQTTANLSVVPVGADGSVQLALTGSTTHLIADLQGYFRTAPEPAPVPTPTSAATPAPSPVPSLTPTVGPVGPVGPVGSGPDPSPSQSNTASPPPSASSSPSTVSSPVSSPAPSSTPEPSPDPSPSASPMPAPSPSPSPMPESSPSPGVPGGASTATTLGEASSFLYTGADAPQEGVEPGTIRLERTAVIRGRVLQRGGDPLHGARVTVVDHPEYGSTLSAPDGTWALAVNGGLDLQLLFRAADRLPAQRTATTTAQEWTVVDDVVLLPLDPAATPVDLGSDAPPQLASGTEMTDSDGTRRARVFFPGGTTAQMQLPDGSWQPMEELTFRATEYTVGADGTSAMPGPLPFGSGYTYAVELSSDEALAAGAKTVQFNRDVFLYVDNFLGFPIGQAVPTGYFDRERGAWIASQNGQVVEVLGEAGGLAELDSDGDGAVDGYYSNDERRAIAQSFDVGDQLWRVPIPHFTPWDCNWPYGPPLDADAPPDPEPRQNKRRGPTDSDCEQNGSIIACETQVLGEVLPVAGSRAPLHYRSDRVVGRTGLYGYDIPLTGDTVHDNVAGVRLTVEVAGRRFVSTHPATPNTSTRFTWDGRDAFGRLLTGAQPIRVQLGWIYDLVYLTPAQFSTSFGRLSGAAGGGGGGGGGGGARGASMISIVPDRARTQATLERSWTGTIGSLLHGRDVAGGWSLASHHAYDPVTGEVHRGDGVTERAGKLAAEVGTLTTQVVAGNGTCCTRDYDAPPTESALYTPGAVATAPDGTIYFCDYDLLRLRPGGTLELVRGLGVNGGCTDMVLEPDGNMLIARSGDGIVERVSPDGERIAVVAGNGLTSGQNASPSEVPATSVELAPIAVAVAPDGSIYLADAPRSSRPSLRRITPDGILTMLVPDRRVQGIALGPDGSVYYSEHMPNIAISRVSRVRPDGVIEVVAGSRPGFGGDGGVPVDALLNDPAGLDVTADGTLYIADRGNGRIRQVSTSGLIKTIAGNPSGTAGGGQPALQTKLVEPRAVAVDRGSVLVTERSGRLLRRLDRPLPGYTGGDLLVAASDGAEIWQFSAAGRHLRTLEPVHGQPVRTFDYDGAGRLTAVQENDGGRITIERDADGTPTALVSGARRTALTTTDGRLSSVGSPDGRTVSLANTADGLLTELSAPGVGTSTFTYDAQGRLLTDTGPDGKTIRLERTDLDSGYRVAVTDGAGRTSTYEVSRTGDGAETRTITDPAGGVLTRTLERSGRVIEVAADGTRTTAQLSGDPRWGMVAPYVSRAEIRRAGTGYTTTRTMTRSADFPHDDRFRVTRLSDTLVSDGRSATATYTSADRTSVITSPEGRTTTTVFGADGRVASVTEEDTAPVTFSYDAGRLARRTQGSLVEEFGYDADGRLTSRKDATGATTRYAYDDLDRVTSVTLPSGRAYEYGYDEAGAMSSLTMPEGGVHELAYSSRGLTSYTPAGTDGYSFERDGTGRTTGVTFPSGRTRTTARDAGGRIESTGGDDSSTALSYPGPGTTVTGAIWSSMGTAVTTLALAHDGPLLTSMAITGAGATTHSYSYDAAGLLTGAATSGVGSRAILRDRDGLVTTRGPITSVLAGPQGAATTITDGVTTTTLGYDETGRIRSRTVVAGGTTVYSAEYTRDLAGRISEVQESRAGVASTRALTYDLDSRLTAVAQAGMAEEYAYDGNSNLTSVRLGTEPARAATYDAADRVTDVGGVAHVVDADGNVTGRGGDAFTWSSRGELLRAVLADGTTVEYAYDPMGRRVRSTSGGVVEDYFYGNPEQDLQVTAVKRAGVVTQLHYDAGGRVVAVERGGVRHTVITDLVGTPQLVVASNGTVVLDLRRTAYGEELARTGTDPAFFLPIGFAGGIEDRRTGLVHIGVRDYDPTTGRWTSRDPLLFAGRQANLFSYAAADPVNLRDPAGLLSIEGSVYAGPGAGLKLSITAEGISFCAEVGFGLGASVGVDPFAGLDKDQKTVFASLTGGVPGLSGEVGGELDDCGKASFKPKICVGPFCANGESASVEGEELGKNIGELFKAKASIQGKVGGRACLGTGW